MSDMYACAAALTVRFLACVGVFYIAERHGLPTWVLIGALVGALALTHYVERSSPDTPKPRAPR